MIQMRWFECGLSSISVDGLWCSSRRTESIRKVAISRNSRARKVHTIRERNGGEFDIEPTEVWSCPGQTGRTYVAVSDNFVITFAKSFSNFRMRVQFTSHIPRYSSNTRDACQSDLKPKLTSTSNTYTNLNASRYLYMAFKVKLFNNMEKNFPAWKKSL